MPKENFQGGSKDAQKVKEGIKEGIIEHETIAQEEKTRSLAERITDGSISAEELEHAVKLGLNSDELKEIKDFVKWLIQENHYNLTGHGSSLEEGSQALLDAVKKGAKKDLEYKKWYAIPGIDWDGLIEEQAYS